MIFYLGVEDAGSKTEFTQELNQVSSKGDIRYAGKATGLGKFQVPFPSVQDKRAIIRTSIRRLTVPPDMIWQTKSLFTDQLKTENVHDGMVPDKPGKGNLHFIQINFEGDSQFDIHFSHEPTSTAMTALGLTETIRDALTTSGSCFKPVYHPQAPFGDERHINFPKSLLSNLMEGVGYFYGTGMVYVSSVPEYAEIDKKFWDTAALARSRAPCRAVDYDQRQGKGIVSAWIADQ